MKSKELVILSVILGYTVHELHAPVERALYPFRTPSVDNFQVPGSIDGGHSTYGTTRTAPAWEIANVTTAASVSSALSFPATFSTST
ncbi:MAG TPA: hypothetical protein VEU32_14585 [Burkholderiales bacterium]|nr:hypothetical protein [Burkholderiales bacterium]